MPATIAQSPVLRLPVGRLLRLPNTAALTGFALALPAVAFLALFLLIPAVRLISAGFLTQAANGTLGGPVTLSHFVHFFGTSLYSHVLLITLRISLLTAVVAAILGYPVAMVMVHAHPAISRAVTFITICATDRQRRGAHLWLATHPGQRSHRAAELVAAVDRRDPDAVAIAVFGNRCRHRLAARVFCR